MPSGTTGKSCSCLVLGRHDNEHRPPHLDGRRGRSMSSRRPAIYVVSKWRGPGEPYEILGVFDPKVSEKPFSPEPRVRTFRGKRVWEVDCRAWRTLMKKLGRTVRKKFKTEADATKWCEQIVAEFAIDFVAPKLKAPSMHGSSVMRERSKLTNDVRYRVLRRDEFHCMACGATGKDDVLVVDHIHPVSKGGETTMDNLQTLCRTCNSGKGTKL